MSVLPPSEPSEELGVRDFFNHADAWTFRLSPDGKWISYLKPFGKARRLNLFVRPLSGGQARRVTAETKRDVLSYFWKGNDYLVYSIDRQRDENAHLYRVDLRNPGPPTDLTDEHGALLVMAQLDDSDDEMLVLAISGDQLFAVRLNLATLEETKGPEIPDNCYQWLVDGEGIVRGMILVDGLDIILRTRPDGESDFRTVLASDFRHSIDLDLLEILGGREIVRSSLARNTALMAKDPVTSKEMIYAISNIGRNTKALVRIDPDTGRQEEPPLHANEKFDVNGMEVSRKSGVTCARFASTRNEREFLDPDAEAFYEAITRELNLKDEEIEIVARDRAEEKFVVAISSDRNPGECYLFEYGPDKTLKVSERLAERAPQLMGRLSAMEPIEYLSRDGFMIPGYLTLPPGHDPKKRLPLIAIVHGGPWSRNIWGYSPRENREVQFFASRGYAVLQMDFRGSTGYGNGFWEAGFKQWGLAMQDDVTDGVHWAIEDKKIADPKRIAIVGESYGGYAALAAITFPRSQRFQYAAAVDRAGISDLLARMKDHNTPPQCEMVGHPEQEPELLNAVSPALHYEQITTPVFVAHGINDWVVLPSQSDRIVAALCSLGAPVEYLRLNEGHIFFSEESKIEYYERVERFLEKYLC